MFETNNILEVRGLSKAYSDFRLDNVGFSVPYGTIMGFIGENGAGKTTTIKLILGLIKRDGGEVSVLGLDNLRDEKTVKQQLGVVLDECFFHEMLTATDIAAFMKRIYAKNWDNALYRSYLKKFSLPADKKVKEYSRGMKMKLSITAALSHRPNLLILDEATSGLDPVVRSEILDVFFDFIQDEEHAVLMSSHITSDLEKVADYITFIHQGKVVLSDAKDRMLETHAVVKCGTSEYQALDKADFVAVRKNSFGCEALTGNRDELRRRYPGLTMDNATLEDIMLFYAKGER